MNPLLKTYYILVTKDAKPIGLDLDSGGEPVIAHSPAFIHYWPNTEKAAEYAHIVRNSHYGPFEIRAISFVVGKA